jgi:hypothetical protein
MSHCATRCGAAVLASAAIALLAGCGGGGSKDPKPPAKATPTPTPTGIVSTRFGRSVKLDITRKQFLEQAQVVPVSTSTEHKKADKLKTKGADPLLVKKAIKRFGKPKNGVIHIPARDYLCLHYRGEKPDKYSWKFCFDSRDTLQYVVTEGPLPAAS